MKILVPFFLLIGIAFSIIFIIPPVKYYYTSFKFKSCEDCCSDSAHIEMDSSGFRIIEFSVDNTDYEVNSFTNYHIDIPSDTIVVKWAYNCEDPKKSFMYLQEDKVEAKKILWIVIPLVLVIAVGVPLVLLKVLA